jgi:hypothetical protein
LCGRLAELEPLSPRAIWRCLAPDGAYVDFREPNLFRTLGRQFGESLGALISTVKEH